LTAAAGANYQRLDALLDELKTKPHTPGDDRWKALRMAARSRGDQDGDGWRIPRDQGIASW